MQSRPRRRAGVAQLAQKQFTRPIAAEMQKLRTEKLLVRQGLGNVVVCPVLIHLNFDPDAVSLRRELIVECYADSGKGGMYQCVIEYYIQLICRHINQQSGRAIAGTAPVCMTWGQTRWRSLQEFDTVSRVLNADNLDAPRFGQVRFVLVPIAAVDRNPNSPLHSWLLVISPLSKTVEVFNSGIPLARPPPPDPDNPLPFPPETDNPRPEDGYIDCDDDLLARAFAILDARFGRDFRPLEWRVRTDRSPKQGPTNNCGVFSCTSAMYIAFGYPLTYAGSNMRNKRLRIISEILNGGFAENAVLNPQQAAVNQFYYPLPLLNWTDQEFAERYPTLEPGFRRVPDAVLRRLPARVRNKRGKYDHMNTRRQMRVLCRERPELRDVAMKWSLPRYTLDQFKEAVEARDDAKRRRQWP